MAEVFLRRLTRWQADQQREAIADLYVAAYRGEPGHEYLDRRSFLERFSDDVQRPGFDMLVASAGTAIAGCVYGYPPHREGHWWRGLNGGGAFGSFEELTASGRVFALAELMVLPSHRRSGVAGRLHRQLLMRVDASLLTTLLDPGNEAATAAFTAWGWARTGRLDAENGRGELDVWSRSGPFGVSLGEPSARRA
ncbi:GNAT family N-acetyltransferase [Streptomyces sp. NBC_01304]|uniref:GNAT family N-acetyltransferase n=1 Tax=Streptomyces sp. NBC_01304 TaxID=2903818 RepID=UPI002E0F386D|nr:GNAT family N-acetyltransferase [Streptomyces sp. NBC_01304]